MTLTEARQLAVGRQRFAFSHGMTGEKDGVFRTVAHLGYVQIDTISVVERAHHHTLWNRVPGYRPGDLDALLSRDRRIFEYWGHAASYLPLEDYRFYMRRMRAFSDPVSKWEKDRMQKYGHLMPEVLKRIRDEGPLGSRDFENTEERREGWHPKPVKAALEMLFYQGRLMVKERQNFQKIYDLTERVLPDWVDVTEPDDEACGAFFVRRALNAHGIADEKSILDYIDSGEKPVIRTALNRLVETEEVVHVAIDELPGKKYYGLRNVLENPDSGPGGHVHVLILSPFDNAFILRDRVRDLFGFDYAIECYTLPAKRKFGYFVMPILWNNRFVGRLDPAADRASDTLTVKALYFEADFKPGDAFIVAFADALKRFARFNGCNSVRFEGKDDRGVAEKVTGKIKEVIGS
ncbi:YcaQ family DNA glycosylase [bacterium]|nr:YcaQ family DNA glycosylase [bacterium]